MAARKHWRTGDSSRLQQVVWNLLKNASKFTPEGGEIEVDTRDAEGSLILEVADNGIGIAPESIAQIFRAFTQADEEIARVYGGLGLGLAIAKASVVGHGGELTVKSGGAGQGSTFVVSLPVQEEMR